MPPEAEPGQWDILTLIAWWNLYVLPALLILLALVVMIWRRKSSAVASSKTELSDDSMALAGRWRYRTIRTIALVHLGLAVRAGMGLAQELMTLRAQGIPQSFPVTGIVIPAAAVMANLAIGHGLWRLRSWGLWTAIVWDALVAVITAMVTVWQWKYRAAVRVDQWPDYVVAVVLPWFLLLVMILPGTRSLFGPRRDRMLAGEEAETEARYRRPSLLWLFAFLFLIIVTSTLLVDGTDWVVRVLTEPLE